MPTFHPFKVSEIERITKDAVVISFEVPFHLKSSYSFISGQYISLEAEINGVHVRRSYSLCSTPEQSVLSVGVKEVPKGIFSSYINQSIRVGDSLNISPPEGRFFYDSKNEDHSILAIAAGSGITPVFSILNSFLTNNKFGVVTLIYGNKSPEQTMFYKELKTLEEKHPKQLKIFWVFSQSNEEGALFGRIDDSVINLALNKQYKLPDHSFLCGPEPMILESKKELINRGVSEEAIHLELFTASSETKEIQNKADKGHFTLTCDDVTHNLKLVPNKTLLDIALNSRIEVPYSCQGGVCSSCIARVKEGKASMLTNQILTDSEVEEGLVLSCQAVAQSESIYLDYDDV